MATVYNEIGALTNLVEKLKTHGISDFETLDDVRDFRNNYKKRLDDIRIKNTKILDENISNLEQGLNEYKNELNEKKKERNNFLKTKLEKIKTEEEKYDAPQNFIQKLYYPFLKRKTEKEIKELENNFEDIVDRPLKKLIEKHNYIEDQIHVRKENRDEWIEKFSKDEIERQEYILSIFIENKSFFYGAEGEERVCNELKKLPDTYTVINNFCVNFNSPVYDRKNDDRIMSVQIDHVVIGPTGLFLIETKNWSKKSIESLDLFSPVKQLKRQAFALFVVMNSSISKGELPNFKNNWGDRSVSPKNIVALMDHVPDEKYQFVDILKLKDLNERIFKQKTQFTNEEVQDLFNYMEKIGNIN